jgi:hypothetical protein
MIQYGRGSPVLCELSTGSVLALILPAAWALGKVYAHTRGAHEVSCRKRGNWRYSTDDAGHTVAMHARGETFRRVKARSLWPERQGCEQGCLKS